MAQPPKKKTTWTGKKTRNPNGGSRIPRPDPSPWLNPRAKPRPTGLQRRVVKTTQKSRKVAKTMGKRGQGGIRGKR